MFFWEICPGNLLYRPNQEAVRQKNEDISGRVNGIEVTIRDIIYNSELQKLLNERNMEEGQESKDVYGMRMAVNSSIARASSSLYMIDNIAVFAKDGSMIGSLYEFNTLKKSAEYSWFEKWTVQKEKLCGLVIRSINPGIITATI